MRYATYEVDQSNNKNHIDMKITLHFFYNFGMATVELLETDSSGTVIKIKESAPMLQFGENSDHWVALFKSKTPWENGVWQFWLDQTGARDPGKYEFPRQNRKPPGHYKSYLKYQILEGLTATKDSIGVDREKQGNGTGTAGNTGGN